MQRRCEICLSSSASSAGKTAQKLRRVLFEDRIVLLCDAHAERARGADAQSIAELRALFREAGGKRSLLSRRSPLDRRVFPARPEGRRGSMGRRADD
ncbi:MAG TPA: hypothetical protein VG937_12265 [Polyangiaceae bacterium]|jgi:hypothetical protein|nr:hypothetical protein [Polyangiaceae bacterium]